MIRLADANDHAAIEKICRKNAWDGTNVLSAYQAKCRDISNIDWQYCDIWLGESDSNKKTAQYVLCRMGQSFYLVGQPHSKERWEELHRFLSMHAGSTPKTRSRLLAESTVLQKYESLYPAMPAGKSVFSPRMECTCMPEMLDENSVVPSESLWRIYDILAQVKPNLREQTSRDEYTARMLFLKRGGAQFLETREQEKTVAVGAVLLPEQSDYGLIINLCTLPEYRNRGYAKKIVSALCREAFLVGKTPVLDCAAPELEPYYRRLGFQTVSQWGTRTLYQE